MSRSKKNANYTRQALESLIGKLSFCYQRIGQHTRMFYFLTGAPVINGARLQKSCFKSLMRTVCMASQWAPLVRRRGGVRCERSGSPHAGDITVHERFCLPMAGWRWCHHQLIV